jgi:signal transduction histidine kinase
VRRLNPFRSLAARLAAVYLLLFALSMAGVLGVVYWFTAGFIDRQTEQSIRREMEELQARWQTQGYVGLIRLVNERSGIARSSLVYAVATPVGDIVAGNLLQWPDTVREIGWAEFPIRPAGRDSKSRPALALVVSLGPFGTLLVGQDMTDRLLLRGQIIVGFFWAVSVALLAGVLSAAFMGRGAARRIAAINVTIDRITAGAFADRMPLSSHDDELDRLAAKLNGMLDRIGQLMQGLRDVTDNVAHDLRTPLARLRARLELLSNEADLGEDRRHRLEATIAEVDRLLQVFSAMLTIASVESGRARADFQPVDLVRLVRNAIELIAPAAEDRQQTVTLDLPVNTGVEPDISVRGSAQLLAQLVLNLLDNAIKYAPEGGKVGVRMVLDRPSRSVQLTVSDNGPGIPPAERQRVLERFVRLEQHRGTPGHGLGLSLVAAVCRLHGGTITLTDNSPGLAVTVRLPLEIA